MSSLRNATSPATTSAAVARSTTQRWPSDQSMIFVSMRSVHLAAARADALLRRFRLQEKAARRDHDFARLHAGRDLDAARVTLTELHASGFELRLASTHEHERRTRRLLHGGARDGEHRTRFARRHARLPEEV